MPFDPSKVLVIGISSRALFDLEAENKIFESEGLNAYTEYQIKNIHAIPKMGTGYRLAKNILSLNADPTIRKVEVIVLSKNNAATSLRIRNAIKHYGLDITRSAWTGGNSIAPYLGPYDVDLFLSAHESDVQEAVNAGFAAARIYEPPGKRQRRKEARRQIRIAFDGDAVLFSEESEKIYKDKGLDAFLQHEKENARKALPDGPFASLLRAISKAQSEFDAFSAPIRTALITARNGDAHERVVRTLHEWKVRIDEVHFLGGMNKDKVLEAFGADIFFDDQPIHCQPASKVVPTAQVPWRIRQPIQIASAPILRKRTAKS